MELSKLSVNEYMDLLGSDAPAPGGGSAAALSGAQGAALVAMVCALTLGRKKYAEFQQLAEEGFQQASEQKAAFLTLMQTDTEAFNEFRAALAMPKETEEERAARAEAIELQTICCILTPLKVMYKSLLTLDLAKSLLGKTNQNAVSDLGVAALNLKTALQGAWMNVKINLPGLPKADMAEAFRQEGTTMLEEGVRLADEIIAAFNHFLICLDGFKNKPFNFVRVF